MLILFHNGTVYNEMSTTSGMKGIRNLLAFPVLIPAKLLAIVQFSSFIFLDVL